ncbi:MAG: ribosome biogenesis/translation initiation ATPase RLI [Candidatus Syntropharchaeia archaeon]
MRIAVLKKDRCQPRRCSKECYKYCPMVRTGSETIVFGEDGKPVISEILCEGCGICIKKCPFDAIKIIGLPDELKGEETHRYGKNGFVLYGLPIPREGRVTGILGPNGTGKTTAINILSGILKPNLGKEEAGWDEILKHYSGSELRDYFGKLMKSEIKTSHKPQYVDGIPRVFKGRVSDLLERTDERGIGGDLIEKLNLTHLLSRDISSLSGGELQRIAIAACMMRDADFYFFDEITPYLDIYQRINAAKMIRELSEEKPVVVVEHDLAILDLLADVVHITYGIPGGYGVITHPKGVRVGINEYLSGYLPKENIRIRSEAIEFEEHAPRSKKDVEILVEYGAFSKSYDGFELEVKGGKIEKGSVFGIVGPNGIGKSTFVKILAGVMEPSSGKVDLDIKISYKPQYVKAEGEVSVREMLSPLTDFSPIYVNEILKPFQIEPLLEKNLSNLSGGELQRVAIAACLSQEADMYILDEPSAHLDIEQRVLAAKAIRRFAEKKETSVLVVDHDIYMIDLISDKLFVFFGEPGIHGKAGGPFEMREGMNRFLKDLGITFRRDETKRPRINKPGSKLDREQKERGEYYYA